MTLFEKIREMASIKFRTAQQTSSLRLVVPIDFRAERTLAETKCGVAKFEKLQSVFINAHPTLLKFIKE